MRSLFFFFSPEIHGLFNWSTSPNLALSFGGFNKFEVICFSLLEKNMAGSTTLDIQIPPEKVFRVVFFGVQIPLQEVLGCLGHGTVYLFPHNFGDFNHHQNRWFLTTTNRGHSIPNFSRKFKATIPFHLIPPSMTPDVDFYCLVVEKRRKYSPTLWCNKMI